MKSSFELLFFCLILGPMFRWYSGIIFCIVLYLASCKPARVVSTQQAPEADSLAIWWSQQEATLLEQINREVMQANIPLPPPPPAPPLQQTFTISAVGDIMMGTNYPESYYLPPQNGSWLFEEVDSLLNATDITFGNLEGVLLDSGGTPKRCSNPKACYAFRTPTSYVKYLVDAGFNLMSTANNHAGDFGDIGRRHTLRVLDSVGIHHAGQLLQPFTLFNLNDAVIGFAAFSPNTGTQSINDIPAATSIVRHLDSLADIVIVSFHGGAEGSKYEHVTRKTEIFYGETRGNVYAFAHQMIDAGADLILGHGPHVTRAMDIYKNRFISYSLGNFCTYARFNLSGPNGLAPLLQLSVNREGAFLEGNIIPIRQIGEGGPRIDEQNRVITRLQNLMKEDFPEAEIYIDDSGRINYIEQN